MLEAIVTLIGGVVVTSIGALIKLYSKVNVQEQAHKEFVNSIKELIGEKFDRINEKMDIKFDGMDTRLSRIERSMNGHLQKD